MLQPADFGETKRFISFPLGTLMSPKWLVLTSSMQHRLKPMTVIKHPVASEKEQALVTRLGVSSEHTVVDLGAGTGTFAIQAALAGACVHAVDVSQAILTYAQSKAQQTGATKIQ